MPPASFPQLALPLDDAPDLSVEFGQRLLDAFANEEKTSGFLPLAEPAVQHMPADPDILCFAATAALLDGDPARAEVFLKRYAKRYVPNLTHHLLFALAQAQQNKRDMALAIITHYGLIFPYDAMRVFPGGWGRRAWLFKQHADIIRKPDRKPAAVRAGRTTAGTASTA